jgi:transcriptional regulator with XRE-family HTH domain
VFGGSSGTASAREPGRLRAESQAVVRARLEFLLARQEITGRELAKRAHLSQSTVSDVLNGKTKDPSLGLMLRLVHGFGLRSIEELIAPLGTSQLRRIELGSDVIV